MVLRHVVCCLLCSHASSAREHFPSRKLRSNCAKGTSFVRMMRHISNMSKFSHSILALGEVRDWSIEDVLITDRW